MKNIIWLSDALDDTSKLGGKASSLRTLFRRGLPVPNAFVVLANVKTLSPELESALLEGFDKLETKEVAVRSSALSEDGIADSWAGQFETYLNVTRDKLIDSVQKCWASVGNERSQAYASARGQEAEADIAVVVQAMIPSELSGVMFSRDPRGDKEDTIVIEAAKGLGEKLVQGEVDPDEYVVDRNTMKILDSKLQDNTALLSHRQVKELADYVMRIETLYGEPQDVEWAIVGNKTYILQARPITTLQHITTDSLIPTWKDQLLFRWGPVPGELYYMNDYVDALEEVVKADVIDYFPEMLVVFQHGEVLYVCKQAEWDNMAQAWFRALLAEPDQITKQRQDYDKAVETKHAFEQKLAETMLNNLSKDQLVTLLQQYYDVLQAFWRPTIPMELANYGSADVLNKMLSDKVADQKERSSLSNNLLLPTNYTYSQEEEFELANATDLKAHTEKWQWLTNSYAGPQDIGEDFFISRKAKLDGDIKAKTSKEFARQKASQEQMIKKYSLDPEIVSTSKIMVNAMLWQDNRKAELLKSVMWKSRLLDRAIQLVDKTKEELNHMPVAGIIALLTGNTTEPYAGYRFKGVEVVKLTPAQNNLGWELYAYHTLRQQMDGVQGVVASRGPQLITHGHVTIVLDPKSKLNFPIGNILVAQMTTPDYIFFMRKASAIVTDTGGITSHAAIVSRELNVPCIVGTKNATTLFRAGDLLQVNTLHGTALRIKKA